MTRTSAPPASRWVANECRSSGRDGCRDAGALGGILQHLPHGLARHLLAAHAEEQRGRRTPARREHGTRPHEVRVERATRVAADGHDALRAALAEQSDDLLVDEAVDVEAVASDTRAPVA